MTLEGPPSGSGPVAKLAKKLISLFIILLGALCRLKVG